MIKNCHLSLFALLFAVTAFAQTKKSGQIQNADSNEPIQSVSIFNENTAKGSTSDQEGRFEIAGAPKDSIFISHVNFKPIRLLFSEIPKVMYLQPSSQDLDEVVVSADIKTVSTLNKIPVKSLDAPVTTNSVSPKVLLQRNVSDLGDAVKSATGVRLINRYGGFQTFRIRGFNNFVLLVDGVRDERHNLSTSAPSTNLANVERIEVLKGPASVLFGHSALGGVINIVRKKPTSYQTGEFKATYGSFDTYNMSVGSGGPISNKLRYRTDLGITRSSGWRDYGVATNNGSLMLNYTPTPKDNIDIYLQANNDQYDTDTGIPVGEDGNVVAGMDPETRYNDPQDYLKHKRFDIQLKYTHKFNEKVNLTNHFSWSDDDINYLSTEWLNFNEAKDSITRGFPFYFNHKTKTIQNQLDLSYSFKTGKIEHKSLFGYSVSVLDRKTFGGEVIGPGAFTTIAVVNPILNQGHIEAVDNNVRARQEFVNSFYLQEWMNFSSKLKALLGVRFDIFNGTYYRDQLNGDRSLLQAGDRTKIPSTALTYRGGLVYQPSTSVSLFASYSNYFKPSRTITPNNQIFDPERGYQAEAGIKWEQANTVTASLSAFYLLKNNIVERNTVDEYNQIGEADSKGVELDIEYTPFEGLYVKAGYAFADARIRAFDTNSLQAIKAGNKLRFAPEHLANAWLSYEFHKEKIKGIGVGSGFNYVSSNFTNADNTYQLPSYFTTDATVYYRIKSIRIALNVNNLMDELYFTDAIYGNQFFPGMGRNFKLSLNYTF